MLNIREIFSSLPKEIFGNQRRLDYDCEIKVYYGITLDGYRRVSFLSSCRPFTIESTKLIKVSQLMENEQFYWTCFDLIEPKAESSFYSFCEDILLAIKNCKSESECLKEIKNRFLLWKKMLGRTENNSLSLEKAKGLFGELYFLKNYMIPMFGEDKAIKSWGGPDGDAKDYTLNDSWYEIKTIGHSSTSVTISSLDQLDSNIVGHLVVIKVEEMSDAFYNNNSSVELLVSSINASITDLDAKERFIKKLDKLKYSPLDENAKINFDVKNINMYKVTEDFPRIKYSDIKHPEIDKITYTIHLKSITRFEEVL